MAISEEIKLQVERLQKRLGRQVQATIYNSSLSKDDDILKAARDCRMSIVQQGKTDWISDKDLAPIYAVRVVAEGLGEIPYALMAEEVFEEEVATKDEPVFSEERLATAALASVVTKVFNLDELHQLFDSAYRSGKIQNEQLALLNQYYLGVDDE